MTAFDVSDLHATGQSVASSAIDQLAGLLKVGVLVNVCGEDRTEDLLDHGDRLGVLGDDDSRLNVESSGVITGATNDDLSSSLLGFLDVTQALVIGLL